MVILSRTVRFSVNDPAPGRSQPAPGGRDDIHNSFAAWPSMTGLGRHYELDVACRGEVNPKTGYFLNIKEIDAAARAGALPVIARACVEAPGAEPSALMPRIVGAIDEALRGRVQRVRWRLSPTYSVEMEKERMNRAVIRQRFEFAASHRLHVPAMTDEENRACFGKCNNPGGHGHNYHVEPAVEVEVPGSAPGASGVPGAPRFTLADLERITNETIIARFDHSHLNTDTAEFGPKSGMNPSVENIAKVCFNLLAPRVKESGGTLRNVTVWETEKTSSTYPA